MTVDGTRAPPRDGASCARRDRGANASADPRKYFKPLSPPVPRPGPSPAPSSLRAARFRRASPLAHARAPGRGMSAIERVVVPDLARRGPRAPRASDPAALVSAHKLAPSAPRAPPPEDPSSGATAIVATLLEASARPLRGTAATREAALRREASAARVRALERSSARRRPPLDPVEVPRPSHRVFSRRPFVGADARANAKDEDALLARAREGRDAVSRSAAPDLLRRAARLAEEVPELPRWATLEGAAAARGFALATRVERPIDVARAFAAHSVAARSPSSPHPPPSARRAVERVERPALAAVAATVSRTLRTKRSGDSIGFANPRRRATTHASRLSAAAATFPFRSRGEGPHSRPDPFPTEALAALRRALPPERESPRASANASGAREGSPEEAPDENKKNPPPPPPSRSAAAAAAFVVLPRPVPATPPRGPRVAAVEPPTLAPRLAPFARRVPRAFAIFSSSSKAPPTTKSTTPIDARRRRRAAGTPRDGGPPFALGGDAGDVARRRARYRLPRGLRRRRRFRLDPRGPGGAAPARSRGSPRGGTSRRRARRRGGARGGSAGVSPERAPGAAAAAASPAARGWGSRRAFDRSAETPRARGGRGGAPTPGAAGRGGGGEGVGSAERGVEARGPRRAARGRGGGGGKGGRGGLRAHLCSRRGVGGKGG